MNPAYRGHPQHKLRNTRWGAPAHPKDDRTPCPPAISDDEVMAVFKPEAGSPGALERAIARGWCSAERRGGWPTILWGRDPFGAHGEVVWEARLSNQETGEYHAYPISLDRHDSKMPIGVWEQLWP